MEFMNRTGKTVFPECASRCAVQTLAYCQAATSHSSGKEDEELMDFIIQALEKRAPFYTQAQYIFNADELEDRWQIESSVQRLQELLEL